MKFFKLKSGSDDLELAVALCDPAEGTRPKAVVQFVHGMCEHKERYYDFMEWLSSQGCVCIIHDHRGHGESVKCKEDLGFMYKGGWKALVDDIKVVGDWARAAYPGIKFVLFGHSMGSLAVRSYVKRYDDTIDELFVCGSPSDNPAKGAGKLLADLSGVLKGSHNRPALMQKMSFGAYNKPFEGEKGPDGLPYHSAWVCSNRDILQAYHKDPLCQYVFTANGFSNLMGMMKDCYGAKGWKMARPELPIHFISGALDPCRTDDAHFQQAVEAMKKVGYSSVSSKLYPGMRHEILNETDKLTVWQEVLALL
jgi:Lysophospholipase